MNKYISIDIGGTAIKYGLIDEMGNILERHEMPTESEKGGRQILGKVVEIVEGFCKAGEAAGICISTAGMVDTKKGEIFYSGPLIPDYAGIQYKKVMEEHFKVPCEVENDVNCAGIAESVSGAAKGSKISVILTIGTGIGGSMIVDGEVFHGFSGSALEVGYMNIPGGVFQDLGAASILTKKAAMRKGEDASEWNGYRVFEEAKQGDEVCIQVIDEMADVLGIGIANICCVVNPEVVVLGGGIMAQEEYLLGRIDRAVDKYLLPGIRKHTRIAIAKHRNDAGMLGAFYHFMNCQRKA